MTTTPGFDPAPYQVAPRRPVRPPLPPRARRGAAIAGGVGFTLLTIGYALLAIPVTIALFAAFIAVIARAISGHNLGGYDDGAVSNGGFDLSAAALSPWIALLVVSAIVGIVLMVVAILVSGAILRGHAVRRPWGVTFAGAGIAIVASWLIEGVLGVFGSAMGTAFNDGRSVGAGVIVALVIGGVVGLAVTAAIGWLSWWWMAHAMRAADPGVTASVPAAGVAPASGVTPEPDPGAPRA
jgi:hypothetical protein